MRYTFQDIKICIGALILTIAGLNILKIIDILDQRRATKNMINEEIYKKAFDIVISTEYDYEEYDIKKIKMHYLKVAKEKIEKGKKHRYCKKCLSCKTCKENECE